MNHDYEHCAEYKDGVCPKRCFRGELVRDLDRNPSLANKPISWMMLKGSKGCLLKDVKDEDK